MTNNRDIVDAKRYRWLRAKDLETISNGGVFAGLTPDNIVLNGSDLDKAVDEEMIEGERRWEDLTYATQQKGF